MNRNMYNKSIDRNIYTYFILRGKENMKKTYNYKKIAKKVLKEKALTGGYKLPTKYLTDTNFSYKKLIQEIFKLEERGE